jgi:SAM-dependent methyltransferase
MIFPWFGGTSAVWIVALMFFQVSLLCGYSYAHWLTRLSSRKQALIHTALLIGACLTLPILPSDAWRPEPTANPIGQIFLLLAATVGLPCVALSATSPLLQAWYVRERGCAIPLWLFAFSNFGSLAALLSFPLILEPLFNIQPLATAWSFGLVVFCLLCLILCWRTRPDTVDTQDSVAAAAPDGFEMLFWILLAASASGLLAAATVQLTTNVAPIPLLWVLPLGLYLLTFILSFSSRRLYQRKAFFPFVAAAIACMAWLYTHSETHQDIEYVIPLYLLCLFVLCMACHGELALRAPAAQYLTRFYLLIALGGAAGGIFVSAIAPFVFDTYLELPILLIVIAEIMIAVQWKRRGAGRLLWPLRSVMVAGVVVLACSLAFSETRSREQNLAMRRNFYGVLHVREYVEHERRRRSLVHGTIRHGYQFTDAAYRDLATSYYSPESGIGRAIREQQSRGSIRFGIVGLGVGTLLTYARAGDDIRVYEINDDVLDIARQQFSYLSEAERKGATLQIDLGDARLTLENQTPQQFDVLAIDAFSSDAIPAHLLTREAFAVYLRHLKPNGILAVHISNRYLDLEPVCERIAEQLKRSAMLVHTSASEAVDASDWILISADERPWSNPVFAGADMRRPRGDPSFKGWTDQYSSLWPLLKLAVP